MRNSILTALLLLPFLASGQVAPEFGFGINFNHTDAAYEVQVGAAFSEVDVSARMFFTGRFGRRRVLVESGSPDLLYQYRESIGVLGVEAEKRFSLTELSEHSRVGAFVGGMAGFRFSGYAGTSADPGIAFQGIARGGAFFAYETLHIQFGYAWFPLPTTSIVDHRAFLRFNILLNDL